MEEDGSPGSPGGVDRVGKPGAPGDGAPAGVDGIPPELDGIDAEGEPLWPDWDGVEGMPGDDGEGIPPGLDGDGIDGEPPELDELGEGMGGEPLGDCGPWDPLGGWGGVGNPLGLDEGIWGLCGCCGLCWVWVSQAASAAITSPPRANFASAVGLKFKACMILPRADLSGRPSSRQGFPVTPTPLPPSLPLFRHVSGILDRFRRR